MQPPATIQNMIAQLGGNQIFAMAFAGSMYDGANEVGTLAEPIAEYQDERGDRLCINLDGDIVAVHA